MARAAGLFGMAGRKDPSGVPTVSAPLTGMSGTVTFAASAGRYLYSDGAGARYTRASESALELSAWIDQSASPQNLVQSVNSDRPVLSAGGPYSRPSLFFDGNNDYLEGSPLASSNYIDADNAYVIMSFMPQNIASEQALIQDNSALFEDASKNFGMVLKGTIGTNTPKIWAHGRNSGFTRMTSATGEDCTNERPRVAEWRHANSKLYLRIDGGSWIESPSANFTGAVGLGFDFQVGGSGGTTTFFYGHIFEMVAFGGTLPTSDEMDSLRANMLAYVGSDPAWINWEFWPAGTTKDINLPDTMDWYKQCDLGYEYDIRIHPSRTFIRFFLEPGALCPVIDSDAIFGRERAEINSPAGGSSDPPTTEYYLFFGHRVRPDSGHMTGYIAQFHDQRTTGVDADPPFAWWINGSTLQILVRGSTVDPLPSNPAGTVLYEDTNYPLDGSTVLWFTHVIFRSASATGTIEVWRSDTDGASWTKVVDRVANVLNMYAGSTGVYFKIGLYIYTVADPVGLDVVFPKLEYNNAHAYMTNPIVPFDVDWDY